MARTTRIPPAPLVLGLGGLVPFAGLALLIASGRAELVGWSGGGARTALLAYGAIIASFLGGIRWGLALRQDDRPAARDFALSIVPSLAAWACLALPAPWSLVALAGLIGGWGVVDQDLVERDVAPPWFRRLRAILSAGAALALGAAALSG